MIDQAASIAAVSKQSFHKQSIDCVYGILLKTPKLTSKCLETNIDLLTNSTRFSCIAILKQCSIIVGPGQFPLVFNFSFTMQKNMLCSK